MARRPRSLPAGTARDPASEGEITAPARRGRPSKAALNETPAQAAAPARRGRGAKLPRPAPAPAPAPAQDDDLIAEMAVPVDALAKAPPAEARPTDPAAPTRAPDPAPATKPAARWDRATDTVQFDWAEIQRVAGQDGPNQAMAKLLVAARAEGANARWPL